MWKINNGATATILRMPVMTHTVARSLRSRLAGSWKLLKEVIPNLISGWIFSTFSMDASSFWLPIWGAASCNNIWRRIVSGDKTSRPSVYLWCWHHPLTRWSRRFHSLRPGGNWVTEIEKKRGEEASASPCLPRPSLGPQACSWCLTHRRRTVRVYSSPRTVEASEGRDEGCRLREWT